MDKWATCDCGRWGKAPKGFRETLHFMECPCGKLAFLIMGDSPREAGYKEEKRVEFKIVKQQSKK